MPDYSKGKIYIIRSYQTDKVYIGSTTQTLAQRLGKHRRALKLYNKGEKSGYITSCEILQYDDHYIELIKNFPCDCREELQKKEGKYIRKYKKKGRCVNRCIAGRTKKQYNDDNKNIIKAKAKQYREKHKEKHNEMKKQYHKKNKEKIKEWSKQFRTVNQEKIKKEKAKYYEKNKTKINEQKKVKVTCECGGVVRKSDLARHRKTKKHLKQLESQ